MRGRVTKSGPYRPKKTREVNPRWWEQDDPGPDMVQVAKQIRSDQIYRQAQALVYAKLYSNQNLTSIYEMGVARPSPTWDDPYGMGTRLSLNVVQSCIDTAAAKIAKNKTRPLFLTEDGNYEQQERAKGLTGFIDGVFYAADVYNTGQRCFIDGGTFGSGLGKVSLDTTDGSMRLDRVLPTEVFADETESIYGQPRALYHERYMHRDVLTELAERCYHGKADKADVIAKIRDAQGAQPIGGGRASDMIATYEAWRLGFGPKCDGGRRVVGIGDVTLEDKHWPHPWFPFPQFDWRQRLAGIWGIGIAEDLLGIQVEINKLLRVIQKAQHLMAVPRIFVKPGSSISTATWSNDIGVVYETDDKPVIDVGAAIAAEVYRHLWDLYAKAYEIIGISQLSANARKPEGLDAAVALREYHDIESERFVLVGQRFERFYLDVARMMIGIAQHEYEGGKGRSLQVKAPGTKFIEKIAWKDVDLAEDAWIMRAFPTSLLPTHPAAKMQKVLELYEAQAIDRETMVSLLDFPDLESAVSLQTAAINDTRRIITKILKTGKSETPEDAMNLPLAIRMAQSAYLKARHDGVPEGRRQKLLRFMEHCSDLMGKQAPPPQMPGQGAPAQAADPGQQPMAPQMPGLASPALPSETPVLPQ